MADGQGGKPREASAGEREKGQQSQERDLQQSAGEGCTQHCRVGMLP